MLALHSSTELHGAPSAELPAAQSLCLSRYPVGCNTAVPSVVSEAAGPAIWNVGSGVAGRGARQLLAQPRSTGTHQVSAALCPKCSALQMRARFSCAVTSANTQPVSRHLSVVPGTAPGNHTAHTGNKHLAKGTVTLGATADLYSGIDLLTEELVTSLMTNSVPGPFCVNRVLPQQCRSIVQCRVWVLGQGFSLSPKRDKLSRAFR